MAPRNDDSSKRFSHCNPLSSHLNFVGKKPLCRKILTFGPPKHYAPTTPLLVDMSVCGKQRGPAQAWRRVVMKLELKDKTGKYYDVFAILLVMSQTL